jgi:glycosyltransferase involved in cell wall biosynthesis
MSNHQQSTIDNQPLISIVTVVFNSEAYLEATILSVLNTTYTNYEYIIIDGGSTDKTVEIIKQYEDRISCWISESDRGIYDAMNKGIKLARGKIIGILNSGDLYNPETLKIVDQIYCKFSENQSLIITGAMERFDQLTKTKFTQLRTEKDLKRNINFGMPLNHPATFVTKNVYETVGYFNPDYKICGDHDFIFRVYYSRSTKFIFTDRVLASMSMGGVSEKISSLWIRAREKIEIRKDKLTFMQNWQLSLKLLIIGYVKHFLTSIVGQKAVLFKHQIEQKVKKII